MPLEFVYRVLAGAGIVVSFCYFPPRLFAHDSRRIAA